VGEQAAAAENEAAEPGETEWGCFLNSNSRPFAGSSFRLRWCRSARFS